MSGPSPTPPPLSLPTTNTDDMDRPSTITPEFLTLNHNFDESRSSFDTLYAEFSRSNPFNSPPRTPRRHGTTITTATTTSTTPPQPRARHPQPDSQTQDPPFELRSLEYTSDYDPNLMCPICHVPFIDPVVLDCDHTFCHDCFEEYRTGGPSTDRSRCPTCRNYHLGGSRKASRLIRNMCADIRVKCPACTSSMARGCIETHVKECPETEIPCADPACSQPVKRKNFVPAQCAHSARVECECGKVIRLGGADGHAESDCSTHEETTKCPGVEFGCTDAVEDIETHRVSCVFAKLAPYMKKQATLVSSLTEQLRMAKIQNEVLETGLDRLNDLVVNSIQPKIQRLAVDEGSDVEEIERHDLTLPLPTGLQRLAEDGFVELPQTHEWYNDLNPRVTALEEHAGALESRIQDVDARGSMHLMNETLRIREDLSHINGAIYSLRASVNFLVNRERIYHQREAMAAGGAGMRGRPAAAPSMQQQQPSQQQPQPQPQPQSQSGSSTDPGNTASTLSAAQQRRPSVDRTMGSAWSYATAGGGSSGSSVGGGGGGSGPASEATSPMFTAARPNLRRSSGGSSQERVKL